MTKSANAGLESLYREHLQTLCSRADRALVRAGHDSLAVYSGAAPMQFLDDQAYPFKVNPHFKAWVPVLDNPECFIFYKPGSRPRVVFHQPADYWHKPPAVPREFWVDEFELQPVPDLAAARAQLPSSLARTAFVGELPTELHDWGFGAINPQPLVDSLHFARAVKSNYEIECIRRANAIAVRGHRAAEQTFRHGGSEFDAHMAYLEACGQREEEMPYNNIVAFNTNTAVLHYQNLERAPPPEKRSFLIDAGARFNGYASDITRTYSAREDEFAALIAAVDRAQQRLCSTLKAGVDWRDFQLETHREMAQVLRDADVIRVDAEAAVASGVTALFFPHGVGHLLGLQVHDVGGFMRDESGAPIEKPPGQPYLRLTRKLEAGFVVTVEPGLYFIDRLLKPAREKAVGQHINWKRVEQFHPYGGIRVEDNILITASGHQNLTRDAFSM